MDNPEASKQIDITYRKNNPEKVFERKKKWFLNNFEKRLLAQARNTAKVKQLEFTIELSDIFIPEYCPYLGIKLSREIGRGRTKDVASIDRIDPTKGYIKGNIQIISFLANRMKQDASEEELKTFANNILKIYKST